MTVDTSDYPYPLREMRGTWGVEGVAEGSRISMRFDYAMRYGPVGWLLEPLILKRKFRPLAEELLDNWERMIEERADAHRGATGNPREGEAGR